MSAYRTSFFNGFLGRAFAVISAANSVGAASESGRRPRARDLKTLGIEPSAFENVRR